jgi:hypothetical protein
MELILIFSIWYIILGILFSIVFFYVSDFSMSPDELLGTLFLWPLIVYTALEDHGIRGMIKEGFTNDKKGFFNRLIIMISCLIILYSIVYFLV